jgi:uncharacterized protein YegL
MKKYNAIGLLVLLIVGMAGVAAVHGQGTMIPRICERRGCVPPPRPIPLPSVLPVKSIDIDTKINGQVATTRVEQVFRNDSPYTLEGTYFFPIPETASIVEFSIWENGKKLVGEVRSREEARRIYDQIVRSQRDPGLLEYAGKDLFQASIFPIPPNSDKKLEITYSQVLKAESGTVAFKYPLGMGNRAWINRPVEVTRGGESRPMGPVEQLGTVSGRIEITAPQALRNIYSPSHNIDIKRTGETKAVMSFETTGKTQDFQLFYGLSNKDFGMSLVTYREPGKDGYFLLIVSPKDKILDSEIVAKDVVFVLDTSGSMADEGKMDKARSALLFGIRNLREGDRYNVINFAGEEHLMEDRLIAADSKGRSRGEDFVGKLRATGGTNINDALTAALKQFDSSERPKLLVFMTDGLPTVGETNIEKIIANTRKVKNDGVRLFSFGVGYDVNTKLLDKIAEENSGTAEYVEPKEDLEIKVSNFFSKVNSPVLTDLELNFGALQTDLLYPRKNPDLFRGSQITMIGRYKNSSDLRDITLKLSGKAGKEVRTFNYENLSFPLRAEDNNFLPRLWATRRVGWLMEQIRSNGDNKEVRDEVVELGTRFGIVTPYTSYLATDGSERRENRDLPRPASGGLRLPEANRAVVDLASGQEAVQMSKNAKKQQDAEKVEDKPISTRVQNVGTKTFYLDSTGFWVDSEYKAEKKLTEISVKFASSGYFDLIAANKEIGQILALGEQIVFVWNGKVYRITK